jgi:hypothetical protein
MENSQLMKETGRYLEDYLEAFMKNGFSSELKMMSCGVEIHPSQAMQFEGDVQTVDLHKSRFCSLYKNLPEANLATLREAAAKVEDILVVDMCSWYGERFGLWVAAQNPGSEVHVYNPMIPSAFAGFLFNDARRELVFKFRNKPEFDKRDIEGSVNRLYAENGMRNVQFHLEAMDLQGMNRYAKENPSRRVLFFAERINFLIAPIVTAAAESANADAILAPLINVDSASFCEDEVMRLINKYRAIRQGQQSADTIPAEATARARLFTMMQQYCALKAATKIGDRAMVYRESRLDSGFPFQHPTHYVSTIRV